MKRQAEREDGQLLILPSKTEEVGALSDPTHGSSSGGKGNALSSEKQAVEAESCAIESFVIGFGDKNTGATSTGTENPRVKA